MLRAGDEASANGMTCFLLGNPMTSAQRCRFPAILGEGKSRPACRGARELRGLCFPHLHRAGSNLPGVAYPQVADGDNLVLICLL